MTTATRVGAFLVALAAVFALALGAGSLLGSTEASVPAPAAEHDTHAEESGGAGHSQPLPKGLMVSQDGYTLELAARQASPGRAVPVAFTITGPDGHPVTSYDVEHDKRLHLIAVRRDLTGFQHVHPRLSPSGAWSTLLDLGPGQWRLFADFTAAGAEPLTLGADLAVAGDYRPVVRQVVSRTAEVDGYAVRLAGDLEAGADAKLTLSVTRDGRRVTDLQPYLGAYGHLVALRSGDLAYLHVHPDGSPDDGRTRPGPDVVFYAAVPSAGTYHLYLDFKHDGVVRTAAFTVEAGGAP
jgi:hypothetical protein